MTAERLVAALIEAGLRVTTAESCTGGMLAAALTDVAGASNVFEQGVVTYSNTAKIRLLNVRWQTLKTHGAVSEEVAEEMVDGALRASSADLGIAITGIAGPGGSEFKPEGRVCFGLGSKSGILRSETVEFGALGRERVRQAARDRGIRLLADLLNEIR